MSKSYLLFSRTMRLRMSFCMLSETICLYFIANFNESSLTAGVGLAMVYTNCTCQSVLTGMNNAITVLVAISYGQRDYKACEESLRRGRLLNALTFLPILICAFSTYRFMILCGINDEVAQIAHNYTLVLYPAMFFHVQFDTYR